MTKSEREQLRGYEEAHKLIRKGSVPQTLYDTSLQDPDQEGFAQGWQKACSEAGAVETEGF
jgi:hypothetical protein